MRSGRASDSDRGDVLTSWQENRAMVADTCHRLVRESAP